VRFGNIQKGYEQYNLDESHLDPKTFIFYIEQLKALDAKDKAQYHDFALKCLKDYIKNNPSWRKDDESNIYCFISCF
jgi:hypothetical protein